MADYAVASGERGVHDKTLVAATVDTVTFAYDLDVVRIVKNAGPAVYVTVDGTTPTVSGNNTDFVPADVVAILELGVPRSVGDDVHTGAVSTVIKLISAGTPTYSVIGVR